MWQRLDHRCSSRVSLVNARLSFETSEDWNEAVRWLCEALDELRRAIPVKMLDEGIAVVSRMGTGKRTESPYGTALGIRCIGRNARCMTRRVRPYWTLAVHTSGDVNGDGGGGGDAPCCLNRRIYINAAVWIVE